MQDIIDSTLDLDDQIFDFLYLFDSTLIYDFSIKVISTKKNFNIILFWLFLMFFRTVWRGAASTSDGTGQYGQLDRQLPRGNYLPVPWKSDESVLLPPVCWEHSPAHSIRLVSQTLKIVNFSCIKMIFNSGINFKQFTYLRVTVNRSNLEEVEIQGKLANGNSWDAQEPVPRCCHLSFYLSVQKLSYLRP